MIWILNFIIILRLENIGSSLRPTKIYEDKLHDTYCTNSVVFKFQFLYWDRNVSSEILLGSKEYLLSEVLQKYTDMQKYTNQNSKLNLILGLALIHAALTNRPQYMRYCAYVIRI